ncbi:MAG: RecQ family ATP-dependent DNA helicase, partial [Candidatus Vecturithrix sp.]|nr:RecQ family ATP-dependent DNA helicase [Candidatus Vecturithrix sp.]
MPQEKPDLTAFVSQCVALDLEIHPETHAILKIGAIHPAKNTTLSFQGTFERQDALKQLDDFCCEAGFLLGHNISRHDIPYLQEHDSWLKLCALPLIDTLFLSPLAFPKNPYHRLVKDYKIVKQAVNNPVEDARCTISLFHDQLEAFKTMEQDLLALYGRLLQRSSPHDGYERLFQELSGLPLPDIPTCRMIWAWQVIQKVCQNQGMAVFDEVVKEPESAACLAYILAWVRVAGENSVLPPWVRYQFPQIPDLLDRLRGNPCLQPDCAFCQEHHDPLVNLNRYFGFSAFRPLDHEIPPLQQQVVAEIIRQKPCLAVLPTGYGKSVCYQLPALMKARQRNQLSLIISPLQSLMKDQVDSMKRKGILNVGTINGLLTMLERSQVLEEIRLGSVDLLWLAPEQLRNTSVKSVLKQREIGMVIIDEAHCLSKWGHDFRPDYLYIARFFHELCDDDHSRRFPQIACFTATAKKEVIEEIQAYFKEQLGADLTIFLGGHERKNLHYIAESVGEHEKVEVIHERLTQILQESDGTGGGIVFASTRGRVEKFSRGLADRGWLVDFFHGARTPEDKRQVQERFLAGELQVIVATNAFGMGVDKPDVRVVIHADVPGSLENYLQEAGRAGRDGEPAWCFLLFNEEDLETQFKLSAYSRLEWRDMSSMLTGLKYLAVRDPNKTVILTSGELLRSEAMEMQQFEDLSVGDSMYDTKVKTALAWLERSGKVLRGDNRTQVIQGKVLVENLQEAKEKIGRLNLSQNAKSKWLTILEALLQADPKELLNTDKLSLATGLEPRELLSVMHSMREAGVINHDLNMTAYVHRGIANDSSKRFQQYLNLEKSLLAIMEEEEPDLNPDTPCMINLRSISQNLKDHGETEARPDRILLVLDLMVADNLLRRPYPVGEGTYSLYFKHDWAVIRQTIQERTSVCAVILNYLLSTLPANARGKDLLVSFRSGELHSVLKEDMTTCYLNDLETRMRHGLLTLHTIRAICLQSGLTVFRPAMTITVKAESE